MAKNPAFPFYASDFLTDTNSWDAVEVGIYIRLLSTQWVNGFLPEDLGRMARISGVSDDVFKKAWVYFSFKFALEEGIGYKNPNLEEIRLEKMAFIEKQKENGKRGGRGNKSDKNKGHSNPSLSVNESQIKPLEDEYEIEIEEEKKELEEEIKKTFSPLLNEYGYITPLEAKERYLTRPENIESMRQLAMVKYTTPEYILKWVDKFTQMLIAKSWKNTMEEWLKYFGNWIMHHYKSEIEVMQLNSGNSKTKANLIAAEMAKQNLRNAKRNS